MTNKVPFTEDEGKCMSALIEAYNTFTTLPGHHPSDMPDFVHHIHALQNLLMARVACRDYPHAFKLSDK